MGSLQMGLHLSLFCTLLFLSHLAFLCSASEAPPPRQPPPPPPPDSCPRFFNCGTLRSVKFPFMDSKYSPRFGMFPIPCNESRPKINLGEEKWYDVIGITQDSTVTIRDSELDAIIHNQRCDQLNNLNFPNSSAVSFIPLDLITLFKCHSTGESDHFFNSTYGRQMGCKGFNLYYKYPHDSGSAPATLPPSCSMIQLPASQETQSNADDLFALLTGDISLQVRLSPQCSDCYHLRHGICGTDARQEFVCLDARKERTHKTLILSTAIPGGSVVILLVMFLLWHHSKWNKDSSYLLSRNNLSKADAEGGSVYFGVPVLSYSELQEATNNFDQTKELGDGGFGTVYHGKLRDGREVAVKRLYEHNYKRMEQFMNEIEILTRLRHRNLVALYGCTSRRCRDLLLVYEYIPNGTVADHLHGNRSKPSPLPWTARINIAVETANALTYLHASDIIHRDVKTNNILLDDNFCVKVADFGLSRLFPTNVTHVSTAPQGTPGYVDPDYHQCYQLTDKSDVYSFGVVLVELISSMQAVDIGRHWHEINLANLAMNRIQQCAFDELIDPSIGFESDPRVRRMAIAVAELAFQCLQPEKEMRPAMDEVLEALNEIRDFEFEETGEDGDRSGSHRLSEKPPHSPESENVV